VRLQPRRSVASSKHLRVGRSRMSYCRSRRRTSFKSAMAVKSRGNRAGAPLGLRRRRRRGSAVAGLHGGWSWRVALGLAGERSPPARPSGCWCRLPLSSRGASRQNNHDDDSHQAAPRHFQCDQRVNMIALVCARMGARAARILSRSRRATRGTWSRPSRRGCQRHLRRSIREHRLPVERARRFDWKTMMPSVGVPTAAPWLSPGARR